MYFFLEKFEWKSYFSRREREYFFINLVFRDENEKSKIILKVEREKIKLILKGIPDSQGNSWFSREFPGTGIPVTLWSNLIFDDDLVSSPPLVLRDKLPRTSLKVLLLREDPHNSYDAHPS